MSAVTAEVRVVKLRERLVQHRVVFTPRVGGEQPRLGGAEDQIFVEVIARDLREPVRVHRIEVAAQPGELGLALRRGRQRAAHVVGIVRGATATLRR